MTVAEDKFYRARITRRVDFSSELWMVRAEPSGEFTFSPGQYATLGVRGTHKVLERPYSIVSAPFETELPATKERAEEAHPAQPSLAQLVTAP